MGILELPKRFHPDFASPKIKPKCDIEVDWSNTYAKKQLKACYIMNNPGLELINLVDGDQTTITNTSGSLSKSATERGVCTNCVSSDTDFWLANNPYVFDNDKGFTLFVLARYQTSSNFASGVLSNRSAGRSSLKAHRTQGITAEYDQGFGDTASSLLMSDQDWHFLGNTHISGNRRFFLDRAFENNTTSTTSRTTTLSNIGNGTETSRGFIGNIALVYGFEANFSDAEILDLQLDPYQILKPAVPQFYFPSAAASATAALTGSATATIDESDIVTGSKTIILTLTGDTFVTGTSSEDGIAGGSNSDKTGANKWNALIKVDLDNTDVVLSGGDTVATITLPAYASYDTDEQEVITWTIPSASLTTSGSDIIASPTFTIDAVSGFQAAWAASSNVLIQAGM